MHIRRRKIVFCYCWLHIHIHTLMDGKAGIVAFAAHHAHAQSNRPTSSICISTLAAAATTTTIFECTEYSICERVKRAAAAASLKCENNKRFDTLRRHERTNDWRERARLVHCIIRSNSVHVKRTNEYVVGRARMLCIRAHR